MDHPPRKNSKNKRLLWAIAIVACAASFAGGWFLEKNVGAGTASLPLRQGGYQLISPLLSCNSSKSFPQDTAVSNAIQSVINQHESMGDINSAAAYFADFSTGKWAVVNPTDKYYPSSLGKVPILMAYYEMAESSSTLFNQEVTFPVGSPNLNAQQEITPEEAIVPGQTYTVAQLLSYMIKYSDNNAAQLLYSLADQSTLDSIYTNLQIPVDNNVVSSTLDFMTPQQYSILFRTLYNSTYLSRDDSEAALQLMTQTSFTQGLVAGVPSSTVVAHKFGIVSFVSGGVPAGRELHDCGIVYAPSNPYLLCVMTRSSSTLEGSEQTIQDISAAVYNVVENEGN
jgi:beta-lactamase class A